MSSHGVPSNCIGVPTGWSGVVRSSSLRLSSCLMWCTDRSLFWSYFLSTFMDLPTLRCSHFYNLRSEGTLSVGCRCMDVSLVGVRSFRQHRRRDGGCCERWSRDTRLNKKLRNHLKTKEGECLVYPRWQRPEGTRRPEDLPLSVYASFTFCFDPILMHSLSYLCVFPLELHSPLPILSSNTIRNFPVLFHSVN